MTLYIQKFESKHVRMKDFIHFSQSYRQFCDMHLEVTGDYPKVIFESVQSLPALYAYIVEKYKGSNADDCLCWESIQASWVQTDSFAQEKEHIEKIEQACAYFKCQSLQELIDLEYVLESKNKRFYLIDSDAFN